MTDWQALWRLYPAMCRPVDPPLKLNQGFSSTSVWKYRGPSGDFVAKAHPADTMLPEKLRSIHQTLATWSDAGFGEVPTPIAGLDGNAVVSLGTQTWEIVSAISGSGHWAQSISSPQLARAVCELARLHRIASQCNRDNPPLRTPAVPQCVTNRLTRIEKYGDRFDSKLIPAVDQFADAGFSELAKLALARFNQDHRVCHQQLSALTTTVVQQQPCLRDVRPCDMFFEGERFTGFVDVAAIDVDFPLTDLTRLVGESSHDGLTWEAVLDDYRQVHPILDHEVSFLGPLARATQMISAVNWVWWVVVEGRWSCELPTATARLAELLGRPEVPFAS